LATSCLNSYPPPLPSVFSNISPYIPRLLQVWDSVLLNPLPLEELFYQVSLKFFELLSFSPFSFSGLSWSSRLGRDFLILPDFPPPFPIISTFFPPSSV